MRKGQNLSGMISAVTGSQVPGLLHEPQRRKWSLATTLAVHVLILAILWFAPQAVPKPVQAPPELQLPRLVFLAEPGPGGGGGGGGEGSSEPPSIQKVAGQDQAQVAINVAEEKPRLVYAEESPEKPEEPDKEPAKEEKSQEVKAPVVAQAPDDIDQKGILEGQEQLLESAGSGNGGGSGTGSGAGIGPGQGSGIGPGWGGGIGGGAYHVGSGVEPPVLRRQIKPNYTDKALARKIAGEVVLEVIILRDGTVGPVRVLKSLDPGLDEKAIEAVRQWLFVPGKMRGQPVDVIAEIVVDFTLL